MRTGRQQAIQCGGRTAEGAGGAQLVVFPTASLTLPCVFFFFFFNDTATTEIYTLSLHDALPIYWRSCRNRADRRTPGGSTGPDRSEEHTSELQSLRHLVCRLLLEKKRRLVAPTPLPFVPQSYEIKFANGPHLVRDVGLFVFFFKRAGAP